MKPQTNDTHRASARRRRSPEATALKATNLEAMDWNLTRKSSSDPFVRLGFFFPKDVFWKKTVGGFESPKRAKGFLKPHKRWEFGGWMCIVFFFRLGGVFSGTKCYFPGGLEIFFGGEHAGGDNLEDLEGGWM